MSRGHGKLQRALIDFLRHHGRPLTFDEIRGGERRSQSRERSVRRALHRLIEDQFLIALGNGGPADPHKYFFHPLMLGMWQAGGVSDAAALSAALLKACESHSRASQSQRPAVSQPDTHRHRS